MEYSVHVLHAVFYLQCACFGSFFLAVGVTSLGNYKPIARPGTVFIGGPGQFPSYDEKLNFREKTLVTVRCRICRQRFKHTVTGTAEVHFARHLDLFPACKESLPNRLWLRSFLAMQAKSKSHHKSGHSTTRKS